MRAHLMNCLLVGFCVWAACSTRAAACDDCGAVTGGMPIVVANPVVAATPIVAASPVVWQAASPVIDLTYATSVSSYVVARPVEQRVVMGEETVTVQTPVYETVEREERVTVRKPVLQRSEREESYIVRRPVVETAEREERVVVERPVCETVEREEQVTVLRPVVVQSERLQTYTALRPVTTYRLGTTACGTCAAIPQVSYVPQQVVQRVPVQTVQYVAQQEVRRTPVQRVRDVQQQEVRKVPVQTVRYVEERVVRKVPVETLTYVDEQIVRKVPTVVCRMETRQEVRRVPVLESACPVTCEADTAIVPGGSQAAAVTGRTFADQSTAAGQAPSVGEPTSKPSLNGTGRSGERPNAPRRAGRGASRHWRRRKSNRARTPAEARPRPSRPWLCTASWCRCTTSARRAE